MCLLLRSIVAIYNYRFLLMATVLISSLLLAIFMTKIYIRVTYFVQQKQRDLWVSFTTSPKCYFISLHLCFLKVPIQCLLLRLHHNSFLRPSDFIPTVSFPIGISFYSLLICHILKPLAGSFSVSKDNYTVPETQYLEHLMALMKPVIHFGSKIFLLSAIITSQYISQ